MTPISNLIEDITQLHFLTECKRLYSLSLEGNKVANMYEYRNTVRDCIPQLHLLDEKPLNEEIHVSHQSPTKENILQLEQELLQQSIKYANIESVEETRLSKEPIIIAMTPRLSAEQMIDRAKRPSSSIGFTRPTTPAFDLQTSRPRTPIQLTPRPQSARSMFSNNHGILTLFSIVKS